jgi:hypothetical protein
MIWHLLAVLAGAFIWANLEVQIEGPHGWAKNLPTWRIEKHFLLDIFMGGRALTGFHTWAFSFVAFAFHLPLVWLGRWTWPLECEVLGSLMLFWVVEDFLWFIINPHYGWRRYREQKITWHPRWFLGIPVDHWGMLLMSALFLAWSHYKS